MEVEEGGGGGIVLGRGPVVGVHYPGHGARGRGPDEAAGPVEK